MDILTETVDSFDVLNLFFTAVVFGVPSSVLIVYLSHHLCKEKRNYEQLLKASPEFYDEYTRKYNIAKVKYALMLVISILELSISLGIAIPNMIYELTQVAINPNQTFPLPEYLYKECEGETLDTKLTEDCFSRLSLSLLGSSILAFFFLIRCLCYVMNNVYIERKKISNFKTWLPLLALEVVIITFLGILNETVPFQLIAFIVAFFVEFGLCVKAVAILRRSIILRHFELNRDYPNSTLSAKAYRDIKYFTLTSRFTLAVLFCYIISIVCWFPVEGLLIIIFNFPCYIKYFYGFSSSSPHMIVAPQTATLVYELVHVVQNIAILIANVTIVLLYTILLANPILKRLNCTRTMYPSPYAIQKPELITSLLAYNAKCYAEKNICN